MNTFQIGDIVKTPRGYLTVNKVAGDKLQCLTSAGNLVVVAAKAATFFKKSSFKGL